MIKSIDNSSANNVSNSLLGWSVAAPTNDSSSDDDGINGIHQAQLHQKKHSNTGEDDTEPSTLRTEYILHSSAYSNPSQTQLHHCEDSSPEKNQEQHELSKSSNGSNLNSNYVLNTVLNPVFKPVSVTNTSVNPGGKRLSQPSLSLDTKQVPTNNSAAINTVTGPTSPWSSSEHSTVFTASTRTVRSSHSTTHSSVSDLDSSSSRKRKYPLILCSPKHPRASNEVPASPSETEFSTPLKINKNTVNSSRRSPLNSTHSTPVAAVRYSNSTKAATRNRIPSFTLQQQQSLQKKLQRSYSSSASSSYSDQTTTSSEYSNLTNLVTSVPALKLKPTSSPSTPQTASSDDSLVSNSSLLHLPKYTGANKPLFEKPLPVTPTFPISCSYPLTPPEVSDSQLQLFHQPQVITSLVTPVAPVPTRPLSLTLAKNSNSSSGEIPDFSKYNNRYSCSEIMMLEERLKQMNVSYPEIFPPTPGELPGTSSFSAALAPAKFSSSRKPVLTPGSPNDRFNLHMVTTLDNSNKNNRSNTGNSSSQDTTTGQKKHDGNVATPSKRFSFLWRKRKTKQAASDEAKMPATPKANKPAAAATAVDTPTTITIATPNKKTTAAAESPMNTRSPVDDAYDDGGSPSTVVPLPQQQQKSDASPEPEVLTSLVDSTSPSPSSVVLIQPRSQLGDKSVRKSLSYELDDEVERRASQEVLSSSNHNIATTMESSTDGTTDTAGIATSTNLEKQKKSKDFVQKPGFTVHRSNSSLRTALPPPSLPLSSLSTTAANILSPIKSSSSSLPNSAKSNPGERRLSIAPSLARNSLISQYSPVIEHATEVSVSQPSSTSPDNNPVAQPPYRRASISEVSTSGPKSRPGSAVTDSASGGHKPSIVVIEKSRRSTAEMESVLSDMKALRKASLKGKKPKEQESKLQLDESDNPKVSKWSSTPTSGALSLKPTSPVMASKLLPANANSAVKSQPLSDISHGKELPDLPVPLDSTLNESETTPQLTDSAQNHSSAASMAPTTTTDLTSGPGKILSPVPGSTGSSRVDLPVEPSLLETQLSHELPADENIETDRILPPEPPFAESGNPDVANSSTETFVSAQSHQEVSSDEHQTGPSTQSQPSAAVLQSPFPGISNVTNAAGKSGLTNLMIKARQQQKRLAARSVSSPLGGTSFPPSLSLAEPQQKSFAPNVVAAMEEDGDSDRFAHAYEDEVPPIGTTVVEPLAPPRTRSSLDKKEKSKTFYESNTSNSLSSSDGEDIGIRRRVGRRARTSSNPEGLSARQKRSSQRLNQLSRDPLIPSRGGDHHSSKSRSRRNHNHHHQHHHHDDLPADKLEPPPHGVPFDSPSMQQLLDLSHKTLKLRDLDLPPTERVLIEKFVDSLARLSADIATDAKKRPEGIRRLHNALRAIEGWI